MFCGRPERELIFAEPGYAAVVHNGNAWSGWTPPVYYCRSSDTTLDIELTVPAGAEGTLRLYMIDPDQFGGGRRQTITVAGKSLGQIERFGQGRWLEQRLAAQETAAGKVLIRVRNDRPGPQCSDFHHRVGRKEIDAGYASGKVIASANAS